MKIMKCSGTSLFALAALLVAIPSCTRELDAVAGEDFIESTDAAYANPINVRQGWVRVKLSEDKISQLRVGTFTRGEVESGNPDIDRIAASLGATEVRRVFSDGGKYAERRRLYGFHLWYDIKFDESLPVTRAMTEFGAVDGIQIVEPVYIPQLLDNGDRIVPAEAVYNPSVAAVTRDEHFLFNDPEFSKQWHYYNDGTISNDAVAGADINLLEGWKTTTGTPNVIVMIGDGAVDYTHEDLAANMWVNTAEIPGNGIDDDQNGYIDDYYGWNSSTMSGDMGVFGEHGTHVAGTVAAVNNNGIGVCGVAGGDGSPDSGVRLMSVNIYPAADTTSAEEMFLYGADNGAVISQNSWGFLLSDAPYPQSLKDAIQYFIRFAGCDENGNQLPDSPMKGGIVLATAGNDSRYACAVPAMDPDVICVAALSPGYTKAPYSNYNESVDIVAPGGVGSSKTGVYSTIPGNAYGYNSGTSMACPHVSGVAALIVSQYGGQGFTAEECKDILFRSCRPIGKYSGQQYIGKLGRGIVDAGLIGLTDPGKAPQNLQSVNASVYQDNIISIEYYVPADANGVAIDYILMEGTCRGVGKMAGRIEQQTIEPVETLNYYDVGDRVVIRYEALYNVEYEFRLYAFDKFGNRSEPTIINFTTPDYTNIPPRVTKSYEQITVPTAGEEYAWTVDLNEYFFDDNSLLGGDIITFTFANRYDNIVRTSLEGSLLTFVPVAKGVCNMVVSAEDIDGAAASMTWVITVQDGPEPTNPTVENGGISLPSVPVDETLTIGVKANGSAVVLDIYDLGSRNVLHNDAAAVLNGSVSVSVANLTAGLYTVVVRDAGTSFSGSFIKR